MEKDLYDPIRSYFEQFGYVCDGEVEQIDLVMEKDGIYTAVELKQSLDFKAVQQAALRQKVADEVYIGIFTPKNMRSHSFNDKLYLLKRLGIGLLAVSRRTGIVNVVQEPVVSDLESFKQRNKNNRRKLKNEFSGRKLKNNTGGVHGTKLMTNYRENSLLVLHALSELGSTSDCRSVHKMCQVKNSTNIMYRNVYGWFEKQEKGIYAVSSAGKEALKEYSDVIELLLMHENEKKE